MLTVCTMYIKKLKKKITVFLAVSQDTALVLILLSIHTIKYYLVFLSSDFQSKKNPNNHS